MRLLRVEGVNMRFVVEDTQDLKTISGGSQMLLNAIHELADCAAFRAKLAPISLGASAGLFEVTDARVSADVVAEQLRTTHPHLTLVVHAVDGTDFSVDEERVRAANRWGQMSQPSLAFPQRGGSACKHDRVRPAIENGISPSVEARRATDKANFYATFAKRPGLTLCQDLDTLASDRTRSNLDGKIAVIYADGNHFGKTIAQNCVSPDSLRAVDRAIQEKRQALLGSVVDRAEKTTNNELRLETLLWGGDESIWVVPAWRGWETLQFFYETAQWALRPRDIPTIVDAKDMKEGVDVPLHHGAGIVFCHRSAHIHRMTSLAKNLAEIAKKKSRDRSLFAYQVLESFDATGLDLDAFRKRAAPENASMVLDGARMKEIAEAFRLYKDTDPPRGKVHELTRSILGRASAVDPHIFGQHDGLGAASCDKPMDALVKRAQGEFTEMEKLVAPLRSVDSESAFALVPWLHIADLWDYVGLQS